jgi:hypothetical protein
VRRFRGSGRIVRVSPCRELAGSSPWEIARRSASRIASNRCVSRSGSHDAIDWNDICLAVLSTSPSTRGGEHRTCSIGLGRKWRGPPGTRSGPGTKVRATRSSSWGPTTLYSPLTPTEFSPRSPDIATFVGHRRPSGRRPPPRTTQEPRARSAHLAHSTCAQIGYRSARTTVSSHLVLGNTPTSRAFATASRVAITPRRGSSGVGAPRVGSL